MYVYVLDYSTYSTNLMLLCFLELPIWFQKKSVWIMLLLTTFCVWVRVCVCVRAHLFLCVQCYLWPSLSALRSWRPAGDAFLWTTPGKGEPDLSSAAVTNNLVSAGYRKSTEEERFRSSICIMFRLDKPISCARPVSDFDDISTILTHRWGKLCSV